MEDSAAIHGSAGGSPSRFATVLLRSRWRKKKPSNLSLGSCSMSPNSTTGRMKSPNGHGSASGADDGSSEADSANSEVARNSILRRRQGRADRPAVVAEEPAHLEGHFAWRQSLVHSPPGDAMQ